MAKIVKGEDFKKRLNLQERIDTEVAPTFNTKFDLGGVVDKEILDASEQARQIVEEARVDAQKLKSEAQEILNQVREEMEKAKTEGYQEGYEEGVEKGLEMLIRVKELRQKLFDDNEREMVKLVFEIAEKIIAREIRDNEKAIFNIVRMALSDAVGEKIQIRLNPQDYENIKKNEEELLQKVESGRNYVFRSDESVKQGGCVIETEIGTIDAQLETQLGAIKKVLGV